MRKLQALNIDEPRAVPEWQDCRHIKRHIISVLVLHDIVDVAHVEHSSQATTPRERFHHDFMHNLTNQRN